MEIREARADEYAVVGELTHQAYAELFTTGQLGSYGDELRDVSARAATTRVLVAVDETGAPVGSVTYVDDLGSPYMVGAEPATAGIRMLAVRPGHQGRGVGRSLTEWCLDEARRTGCRAVVLHTTEYMPTAQRLYRSLGFARVEHLDHTSGGILVMGFRLDLDDRPPT